MVTRVGSIDGFEALIGSWDKAGVVVICEGSNDGFEPMGVLIGSWGKADALTC